MLDHYRPKGSVAENPNHPGYYWLFADWTNLLPACSQCDAIKGNSFPLMDERKRAIRPEDALEAEKPLLLNPCDTGFDPDEHLDFSAHDGIVRGLSPAGIATIELVGLNRADLCREREAVHRQVAELVGQIQLGGEGVIRLLRRHLHPEATYSAAARAYVRQELDTLGRRKRPFPHSLAELQDELSGAELARKRAASSTATTETKKILRQQSGRTETTGYVTRIAIRNVKGIDSFDREVAPPADGEVSWQVYLGENGAGKSTVLQCLAIALAGRDNFHPGRDFVSQRGGRAGEIRIWLSSNGQKPVVLNLSRSGKWKYRGDFDGADVFLRAYGPTRLLPRAGRKEKDHARHFRRRIDNLFDPCAWLCDAEQWLLRRSTKEFDRVATSLRDVLRPSTGEMAFVRRGRRVYVRDGGGKFLPLSLLSCGQQAAVALACDIMEGIMRDRLERNQPGAPGDFQQSPGIILLDEIDAHLHPRWKMEVVRRLRTAFPKLQFFATTHEPLCLRGLKPKEIVVMERRKGRITSTVPLESPAGWRVDQILTSRLFGLHSTIDPEIDELFDRYYELLGKSDLTADEREELARLRGEARKHNRLGYTRRDQLIYECIDEYLVREAATGMPKQIESLRQDTKRRILEIWTWVDRRAEGAS